LRAEKSSGTDHNRVLENSIRFSPKSSNATLDSCSPMFAATITAPLTAGAKTNSPDPAESNGKSESAKKIYRILIADDHEALRRGLRSALLGAGWQVVGEAADGKQAIEKTGELKPDLVLLDLSMPVMSGHEAAREILRVNPGIKIVVFTMHESQQVRDALSKIGVHALAVKSAPLSLLLDTIQNVLTT
jgi:CheY-like chemotaxis protein